MTSSYEGPVEFKGKGGWMKRYGVLTKGKLDLFDCLTQSLMHTVMLSSATRFKDGKTKEKEFHFHIVTSMSEHYFRVDSDIDREQWGHYIKSAIQMQRSYETMQPPSVRCTKLTRMDSPTDSGFEGACSSASSPFTSPGNSGDGTFVLLNKYKWYLGTMSREEATSMLMKEKGSVFGLSENKGNYVLSIKKLDKASNSYKVTHRLIKTKGSDYRIDGITTFSGSDILDLLKQFMRYCPESLPLGGSLDALNKGTVEEEDPQYTYASTLGTCSSGSSPLTSPGNSGDGTFVQVNKYKWYLGTMSREEATSMLMKEKGPVFGLRENNRGDRVLSIKEFDKASNSYKVTHRLIKTKGSDYRIDGITTFSESDILDHLKQFMQNHPGSLPLGGSLDALKEGMAEEEDPQYTYARDPEEMGGPIQQRLKEQVDADGRQYVRAQEQGTAVKIKYNRAREPWKAPTPVSQMKSSGIATAMLQGQAYSTCEQQGKLVFNPDWRMSQVRMSDCQGAEKADKKPPLPPRTSSITPKSQESQSLYAAETVLEHLCWVPLGFQSHFIGPTTGKLSLQQSTSAIVGEEEEAILLEMPPGAVDPLQSVEIRSALIPDGPFILPEGYQLGSMVVYLYYDGCRLTKPLTLSLPHWYGGEDHVRDGLSFAMASHTLKEGKRMYRFELLEGGKMLSSHCGQLEIDGHSSLFAEVFREGAVSRYQAISLQRERGNETTCDVAITYASPLWCDILLQSRSGWAVSKHSYPITFEDNKIQGQLRNEHGNGWHAAINGPSELQPDDVEYGSHGITSSKLLKKAVLNMGYPPAITCAVTYKEELRKMGRPVWVYLDLTGAGKKLTFMCKAYEKADWPSLDGSRNAAAASQFPPTLPNDMVATFLTLPQAEATSVALPSLTPVPERTNSVYPSPPQPAPAPLALRYVLAALAHQLDSKWRCFGTFLGVEYETIEAIRVQNGDRPGDCMLDLLGRWTSNQAGTGTLPRTWQTVVEAVHSCGGKKRLAQNLIEKHGGHLPEEPSPL